MVRSAKGDGDRKSRRHLPLPAIALCTRLRPSLLPHHQHPHSNVALQYSTRERGHAWLTYVLPSLPPFPVSPFLFRRSQWQLERSTHASAPAVACSGEATARSCRPWALEQRARPKGEENASQRGQALALSRFTYEVNLNVAGVSLVGVDPTVGTVCAAVSLWCLVDNDVSDDKLLCLESLALSVGLGILEQVQHELDRLDGPSS